MSWTDVKVTRLRFSPISGTSSGSAPRRKKRRTVQCGATPRLLRLSTHDVACTQQAFVGLAVGWDGLQAGIFLKTKYAVLWYDAVWYAEKYGEQINSLS